MATNVKKYNVLMSEEESAALRSNLKIFSGSANRPLAEKICTYLSEISGENVPLGDATIKRFSDGEVFVKYNENIRNQDVFIIQPTSHPVNEHLVELLLMIDAARRASARTITAIIPYYGYARQDRKAEPRTPISARLVASLLETAGIDRMVSVDLHANQIQGFFTVPVDNLYAANDLTDYFIDKYNLKHTYEVYEGYENEGIVLVSPDAGGALRCRAYSKRLMCPMAIIDKRRPAPNQVEISTIIGDVRGLDAILLDDMVDTAGSIVGAAEFLVKSGAKRVDACATHAVLSGPALERIKNSPIENLIVTDTIPLSDAARECKKIKVVSMAPLLGEAIRAIKTNASISSLFEPEDHKK